MLLFQKKRLTSTKSYDFVTLGTSKLHFRIAGSAKNVIFLFHGFGQDHKVFSPWEATLTSHYTVYSFDLFYHGISEREDNLLQPKEWKQLLKELLRTHSINRFSVLGYSLGGRFALLTVSLFPKSIERLYLLAPDALYIPEWHLLAMKFRSIFKYLMHHPRAYDQFVRFSIFMGLADKTLVKFSKNELQTDADKKRVYRTWTFFRNLTLTHQLIREILTSNNIETKVILGEKDNIIMPSKITPIFMGLDKADVILLSKRHHEILEDMDLHLLLPY